MTDRQKRTRSGSETRKRRALVVSVPPELDQVLRDGAVRASKRASAYCVANDLNHMLTLTYRGTAPSIEQVLRDSGNLRRSLARHLFDDSA